MIPFKPIIVSDLWNKSAEDEHTWWPRCLWIDPGLSSGYCVIWFDPYVLMGYSREDVRVETRRSGRGQPGGADKKAVTLGGNISGSDRRPKASVRAVLAWQAGFVRGEDDPQVDDLLDFASRLGGRGLLVGCETFIVKRIDFTEAFLSPARIRAILQYELRKGLPNRGDEATDFDRKRLHLQSPSEMTSVSDQRLRLWDMFTDGPDHPRDATRHALVHLRKLAKSGRDGIASLYGWEDDWAAPYGEN